MADKTALLPPRKADEQRSILQMLIPTSIVANDKVGLWPKVEGEEFMTHELGQFNLLNYSVLRDSLQYIRFKNEEKNARQG
jgi:hypothetical protein